ncbi:MAG: zinc ribbon domain-containing protein [Anaerolineae bacterium]|nr:zinc ribbon domain-containing protein [Anaerolineae bacterium]
MGTKEKNKETGHGEFFCPACKVTRHYIKYESAPYFSLYFVPLFKLGSEKKYIQCQVCHNIFSTSVLSQDARRMSLLAVVNDLENELKSGTPSHVIYHKLVAKNFDENLARVLSISLLGNTPKVCHKCKSYFHERVNLCTNCGASLADNSDVTFLEEKKAADKILKELKG